jgi:hypothetical protein
MPSTVASTRRAQLLVMLADARDNLLSEIRELRGEHRNLSERVVSTRTRLERLRQQVEYERERRDAIKKGTTR